jgi:TPR repeat protein
VVKGLVKIQIVAKGILDISAEFGHALSQYKLEMLTLAPKSSYYNIKDAIEWFELASCSDFINAHYQLGILLESGNPSEKEQ